MKCKLTPQKGFTLVELLIVVAIIGIIAGIGYPSYQESVRKSRRADAKGALLGFANAMERHYTENNSYCNAGTTTVLACVNATGAPIPAVYASVSPVDGGAVYYNLRIASATANSYNLRAIAINGQLGDGNLEINSTESKGRWDKNADLDTTDAGEGTWD